MFGKIFSRLTNQRSTSAPHHVHATLWCMLPSAYVGSHSPNGPQKCNYIVLTALCRFVGSLLVLCVGMFAIHKLTDPKGEDTSANDKGSAMDVTSASLSKHNDKGPTIKSPGVEEGVAPMVAPNGYDQVALAVAPHSGVGQGTRTIQRNTEARTAIYFEKLRLAEQNKNSLIVVSLFR